jgi:hypothetical protein
MATEEQKVQVQAHDDAVQMFLNEVHEKVIMFMEILHRELPVEFLHFLRAFFFETV